MKVLLTIFGTVGILVLLLPYILQMLGLHPNYRGETFNLKGRRALVITTSHDQLGDGGEPTGVYASEMTAPYYEFLDAQMQVDVASIKGGAIPIEPMSVKWPLKMSADKRFEKDEAFKKKVQMSLKIDDLDFTEYDIIYMAGGWGAAYDLGFSEVLGVKITEANAEGIILGSICHGALGFLKAKDSSGNLLVKGKHMSGVTDKQVRELGITITPHHPERELRAAGAIFESKTAFKDFFADYTVVDGNIVTGQNQNAGKETAQKTLTLLQAKIK